MNLDEKKKWFKIQTVNRIGRIARFMKFLCIAYFVVGSLAISRSVFGQGFINLDFESANVSGYSPFDSVPIANALPGWTAYVSNSNGTNTQTTIVYDGISIGGPFISIVDTNVGFSGFYPIQGKYSAYLFGASGISVTISQTGMVPTGTESLLFDALASSATFVVTLGGQTINAIPLQTFSNYTLYGADISTFAGEVEALSFTEPPAPVGQPGGDPNILKLDNIQFSSSAVPEPSTLRLFSICILFLCWRIKRPKPY